MSPSRTAADTLLSRIEWTVIRRLDGLLQGDYRGLFRGIGIDLAGLRPYEPPDDVRSIDWNVTARLQEPHVRVYNEDREITAWFLLDVSPSLDFGTSGRTKRQVAAELFAVLSRLLMRRGNRIGAIFFGGTDDRVIPAMGGRAHALSMLDLLLRQPALDRAPATSIRDAIETASRVIRHRSVVFLISDFASPVDWAHQLGALAQRNEVISMRVVDPFEIELPDAGILTIQDAETGERLQVDTGSRKLRDTFTALVAEQEAAMSAAMSTAGVDGLEVTTRDDLIDTILRFAHARRLLAMTAGATTPGRLP